MARGRKPAISALSKYLDLVLRFHHHVHSLTDCLLAHYAIHYNLIFGEISTDLKTPTLLGGVPLNDFMQNWLTPISKILTLM